MSRKYKVKRYGSIYGPSRKKSILKNSLTVVGIAVLFLGAWIVYEPFMNFIRELQSPAPLPPISSGIQEEPQGPSQPQEDGTAPVSKPVTNKLSGMVYMPASIIQNKDLLTKSLDEIAKSDAGIDGIIFDLKSDDGTVLYKSSLEQVEQAKAQAALAYNLDEIVETISKAGFVPIGRLYVFKDSLAPKIFADAAVKYVGTEFNWVDNSIENGGKPWLNPYSPPAAEYNLKIIGEAMDKGVKNIIMDGVQFPTGFSLEKAYYGTDASSKTRAQILLDFARTAEELVTSKNKDGRCWLSLPATALALKDTSPLSPFGGNISELASYSNLMVDFKQSSMEASSITNQQLGIENPSAPYSEVVSTMVRLMGTTSGKVTPVIQATSAAGAPEPDSTDIKNQLKILKDNNMSEGYVLWSITGSYRHLLTS